ncbi:MAG TPA: hypothetical protein ENK86_00235 [Campylobacterales bacterium]|nr:hypothetical protein [Campylobacterales bacterium]
MFDNNEHDDVSFSDAYKSEILGTGKEESEKSNSLLKIVIILLLLAIIIGVGIFAYLYYTQNQKSSNDVPMPPQSSTMLDNIEELEKEVELSESPEKAPEGEANHTDTKNQITLTPPSETPKEESPKTSTQKGEETYLEQLAELSKEIDGEK